MNYIEIINHFWQMRRSCRLTSTESDLYYFLVQESNIRSWQNPFACSNRLICATIGISSKTLTTARKKLMNKGFITYEPGNRNKKMPKYTITLGKRSGVAKTKLKQESKEKAASKAKIPTAAFAKPTVNQIDEYCKERNSPIDAQRFYDFYESKDWMIGANSMRNWQAAVRNWERRDKEQCQNNKQPEVVSTTKKQEYEQF